MVVRKDWIAYDFDRGDFFHLTITSHPPQQKKRKQLWFITHYENHFDLSLEEIDKKVSHYYIDLLGMVKSIEDWTISMRTHDFSYKDMNVNYWQGLLHKKIDDVSGVTFENLKYPINKCKLEKEIHQLAPTIIYSS